MQQRLKVAKLAGDRLLSTRPTAERSAAESRDPGKGVAALANAIPSLI